MALLIKFLPLMLIIALICLIVYAVRDMRRTKSGFTPVYVKQARVCGKRSSINDSDGQPDDLLSMTSYFVEFIVETGERIELRVPNTVYETISETDEGTLKYQGERYIGFENTSKAAPLQEKKRKIS